MAYANKSCDLIIGDMWQNCNSRRQIELEIQVLKFFTLKSDQQALSSSICLQGMYVRTKWNVRIILNILSKGLRRSSSF